MEELEDNRDGGTGLTRGLMTLDPSPFEGTGLHMDVKPPPTGAGSNSPTHEMVRSYDDHEFGCVYIYIFFFSSIDYLYFSFRISPHVLVG